MNKKELYKYIGNIQQLASIRKVKYLDGNTDGLEGYQIKNGLLDFTVMSNRCMDIGEITYKGVPLNFLAKPGLLSPLISNDWDELRSIMCGLFFTVGPDNIGGNFSRDDLYYPLHGSFRLSKADHTSSNCDWNGESYTMNVSGEIHKGILFGDNVVLKRTISTSLNSKEILITDELENEAYTKTAGMMLYHFNLGYPILCEDGEIVLPSLQVEDRDEMNYEKADTYKIMSSPADGVPESVYMHQLASDKEGNTFAAYINPKLKLGLKLEFNKKVLPNFVQWKSTASGDYVLGLEPTNSHIKGRIYNEEQGTLVELAPFEKKTIQIKITVLDGIEELNEVKNYAEKLKEMN